METCVYHEVYFYLKAEEPMEQQQTPVGQPGYPISAEALDLEIYQLACTFAASHELTCWARKSTSFERLRNRYERSEASRRLVALAATLRNVMDSWPQKKRNNINKGAGPVGVLIESQSKPTQKKPLDFREACHKLVHAERINFDVRRTKEESLPSLRPIVHLYGTKPIIGSKQNLLWKAELQVVLYLKIACGI